MVAPKLRYGKQAKAFSATAELTDQDVKEMTRCDFYKEHPGSCDPHAANDPCIYCKLRDFYVGRISIVKASCPDDQQSFTPEWHGLYRWRPLSPKFYDQWRVCVVELLAAPPAGTEEKQGVDLGGNIGGLVTGTGGVVHQTLSGVLGGPTGLAPPARGMPGGALIPGGLSRASTGVTGGTAATPMQLSVEAPSEKSSLERAAKAVGGEGAAGVPWVLLGILTGAVAIGIIVVIFCMRRRSHQRVTRD